MRNLLAATVCCGALLLGGMALAQTSGSTSGSGTMSPSTGTTSSMGKGSGSTGMSSSGATSSSHRMTSESDVKKQLQAQGYSDVSGVKQEGDHYTANAKQDGKSVKVRVDASSGMVTKEQG